MSNSQIFEKYYSQVSLLINISHIDIDDLNFKAEPMENLLFTQKRIHASKSSTTIPKNFNANFTTGFIIRRGIIT